MLSGFDNDVLGGAGNAPYVRRTNLLIGRGTIFGWWTHSSEPLAVEKVGITKQPLRFFRCVRSYDLICSTQYGIIFFLVLLFCSEQYEIIFFLVLYLLSPR